MFRDPSAASDAEDNPFLQHAQMDLSDPQTASQALNSLVNTVWGTTLDCVPTSELRFAELLSCPAMAAFWSAPFCHPWRPPVWRWDDDAYWSHVDPQTTHPEIVGQARHLKMSPAAFKFKAYPGVRLASQVRHQFGLFGDQGVEIFFPNENSAFFYLTFKVCRLNSDERLTFAEFSTVMIERQDPTAMSLARLRYNLLAIVKCARKGDDDTIRLYNSNGSVKIPRVSGYTSPKWKMDQLENGDKFFAVYAKSWLPPMTDPPFPESEPPEQVTGARRRLFESAAGDLELQLDEHMYEASDSASDAGSKKPVHIEELAQKVEKTERPSSKAAVNAAAAASENPVAEAVNVKQEVLASDPEQPACLRCSFCPIHCPRA